MRYAVRNFWILTMGKGGKKMKKVYRTIICLLALVLVAIPAQFVSAADTNFSVKSNIPSNQLDKSKSYFDLKVKPGQKQTIFVTIQNAAKHPIVIEATANTAVTNDNGVVEYSKTTKKKDSSLQIDFNEIVKIPKEIKLAAKETKKVPITLSLTKEKFDGVLLGGLYFTEKTEKKPKKQVKQVENHYAYAIGVVLTQAKENKNLAPNLILHEVKATQRNYRNVVQANIQNNKPAIIPSLEIKGNVKQAGKSDILYTSTQKNLRMAPNSNFNYTIPTDNKALKKGKYVFVGTATDGKRTWKFHKNFTITGDEASSYNKQAVEIERDNTGLIIGIAIGVAGLLIGIIILLIYLLRKKDKRDN